MQHVGGDYVIVTYSPQPSFADFLKSIVESAGFVAEAVSTDAELERAATAIRPDAIVYEVGFPFSENWRELTRLRSRPAFHGVPFVITTPDAAELYRRVGVPAIEVFRRPDDLSEFTRVVLSAIGAAA
jgi:DNA-binding response OmpR family regulator